MASKALPDRCGREIAICQHPNGEGVWWEISDEHDANGCIQQCDCTPKVYTLASVLADGLSARGIIPGRNPDGVNDDTEKALTLLDGYRAENERLRKALTDIARMSTPSRMQSRANRALAPASDENGETT